MHPRDTNASIPKFLISVTGYLGNFQMSSACMKHTLLMCWITVFGGSSQQALNNVITHLPLYIKKNFNE